MIDYKCKPYIFIGLLSCFFIIIGIIGLSIGIYGLVNKHIYGFVYCILYFVCIILSYCGILMSNRFFYFTDEGMYLFDKYKKRYYSFYKWEDFSVVYVFHYYRSYRIIFTTEELSFNDRIDFIWKSHKFDPFVDGYEGFLISTFQKDYKLDYILKQKYGIGYDAVINE